MMQGATNTQGNGSLYPYDRPLKSWPRPMRLVLLGATGSIGRQTIDVVRAHPEALQIVGLGCRSRIDVLKEILAELDVFQPGVKPRLVVTDPVAHVSAKGDPLLGAHLLPPGEESLSVLVAESEAHCLVNGLVGAVGLQPTLAAAAQGMRIALANKETLVMGGDLVASAVTAGGAEILPVDSEHAAIAQCLSGRSRLEIERLILTASGGPFRGVPAAELANVSLERVLAHPTWKMGPKITVDSATLMNKGLEVIEAHHLFGIPYERIDVVVHPGSIVHSLVEFVDGALLAQMGTPDMRIPLQYAISGQRHWPLGTERLDLVQVGVLQFEAPDVESFPCLALAREAGCAGGAAPVILNAANEVAVAALLAERIGFHDIAAVVAECLEHGPHMAVPDLATVLDVDHRSRELAATVIQRRIA